MKPADTAVRRRTLAKAVEVAGGPQVLRRRLQVSAALITLWLSGSQPLPTDIFLKAVDILEEHAVKALRKDR